MPVATAPTCRYRHWCRAHAAPTPTDASGLPKPAPVHVAVSAAAGTMRYPSPMDPIVVLKRWWLRLDRERIQAFAHFLWTRFLDDRCFETAGALAYTTLF